MSDCKECGYSCDTEMVGEHHLDKLQAQLKAAKEELEYQSKIGSQQFEAQRVEIESLKLTLDTFKIERELMKPIKKTNTLLKEALEKKVVKCCKTCDSFVESISGEFAGKDYRGRCPFDSQPKKEQDCCENWNIDVLPEQALKGEQNE